jgi:hypothetical protein
VPLTINGDVFAKCREPAGREYSVIIPDGITSIGKFSFFGCSGLREVRIPDSVTSIGEEAFKDCIGLREIHIPNGVTSIGIRAFWNCSGLQEVRIPDSVTSIGVQAFALPYQSDWVGLRKVYITGSVWEIGELAFSYQTDDDVYDWLPNLSADSKKRLEAMGYIGIIVENF